MASIVLVASYKMLSMGVQYSVEHFAIIDEENDTKLKDVENIPAWKRRFMK
jgi:hypothetical protein